MKSSFLATPRRRRAGTAAAAFSHAMAMTGDAVDAEAIAVDAFSKGARSRSAVLAHARHSAAERAAELDKGIDFRVDGDLRELAIQLSQSRPVPERSFIDMETRYGLDSRMLAEVFGVSTSRCSELSEEISSTWSHTLDPALLAWLGPGNCEELGRLLHQGQISPMDTSEVVATADGSAAKELETTQAPTVGELIRSGEVVFEHAQACLSCDQRLTSMTSVRSLVALTEPLPVPAAVTRAAQAGRSRLPTHLPPSFESRLKKRAKPLALAVAAVVIAIVVVAASGYSVFDRGDSQSDRVDRLVAAAPQATLTASPVALGPNVTSMSVANNGPTPVTWQAMADEPWLVAEPSQGFLEPNQAANVGVRFAVPEEARQDGAALTITSSDGARQVVRYIKEG